MVIFEIYENMKLKRLEKIRESRKIILWILLYYYKWHLDFQYLFYN